MLSPSYIVRITIGRQMKEQNDKHIKSIITKIYEWNEWFDMSSLTFYRESRSVLRCTVVIYLLQFLTWSRLCYDERTIKSIFFASWCRQIMRGAPCLYVTRIRSAWTCTDQINAFLIHDSLALSYSRIKKESVHLLRRAASDFVLICLVYNAAKTHIRMMSVFLFVIDEDWVSAIST